MAKKSFGRKKGIQRSVPRHRIGSKEITDEQGDVCILFRLIGFTRTKSGQYVLLNGRDKFLHYVVIVVYLGIFMRLTLETIGVFLQEKLGVQAFVCAGLTLIYLVPPVVSVGIQISPQETIDMLNSWQYVSTSPQTPDSKIKFHPLHDISTCCKVSSIFSATTGMPAAAGIASLCVNNLPVCLFPTAMKYGLIPEDVLPQFAWQILFAPLDGLMFLPPPILAGFCAMMMFMGTGAVQIYMEPIRKMRVSCMRSRERLERMYVQLELFNRIFQVWLRFFFPSWLLMYAVTVILCMFVAIRYTDLPLLIYIIFPYVGLNSLMLIFWQSFDMLRVSRESEDIVGVLMNEQAPYLRNMTRKERVEKMKRAKVMRPMTFPVADSEFSMGLPITTWDEIINQVLFLMSL